MGLGTHNEEHSRGKSMEIKYCSPKYYKEEFLLIWNNGRKEQRSDWKIHTKSRKKEERWIEKWVIAKRSSRIWTISTQKFILMKQLLTIGIYGLWFLSYDLYCSTKYINFNQPLFMYFNVIKVLKTDTTFSILENPKLKNQIINHPVSRPGVNLYTKIGAQEPLVSP